MKSAYDEKACTLLPGGTTTGVVVTITDTLKLVEVVIPSDPVKVSVVTGTDDVKVVVLMRVLLALSLGSLSGREGTVLLELIEREGKSVKRSSSSESKEHTLRYQSQAKMEQTLSQIH